MMGRGRAGFGCEFCSGPQQSGCAVLAVAV